MTPPSMPIDSNGTAFGGSGAAFSNAVIEG